MFKDLTGSVINCELEQHVALEICSAEFNDSLNNPSSL